MISLLNSLYSTKFKDIREFSTYVRLLTDGSNSNNNKKSNTNESLPAEIKKEIKDAVNDFYDNETPKFNEPDRRELDMHAVSSSEEAIDMYAKYRIKHTEEATKMAKTLSNVCITKVSDEVHKNHSEIPKSSIENRAEKETLNKFYSDKYKFVRININILNFPNIL